MSERWWKETLTLLAAVVLAACAAGPEPTSAGPALRPTFLPSRATVPPSTTPRLVDIATPTYPPGCELPCWFGITPGQTTLEEAARIVDGLPFAYSPEVRQDSGATRIDWGSPVWANDLIRGDGSVAAEDGVVVRIHISSRPYRTAVATAGDIVAQFGLPTVAFPWVWGNEAATLYVGMWYTDLGLAFTATAPVTIQGECLDAQAPVIDRTFTIPGDAEDFVVRLYPEGETRELVRQRLTSWPGFGCAWFKEG